MKDRATPHVLIIVQNLPVPLDRRVWLECQALRDAGFVVSVICPKGPGDRQLELLEGVHLYKYRPPPQADGLGGYVFEFGYCWLRTAVLAMKVARRMPVDVVQACNPPDTYWALALIWKLLTLGRVRFVFDHHDLNPEVYVSRFGVPRTVAGRLQLFGLQLLERLTFRTADHVISTNESYRAIALERGGVAPEATTVVRSGPDTSRMRPVHPLPELRHGRDHLLVYLGIMGPQDGVDVVLRAIPILVDERGLDVHVALLGFGDCYESLVALADELEITDRVTFTGRADLKTITQYLSSADIGLSPDPLNALNDVSTMNKTMEYMAFALPVVAFDLVETRVSGGDAAVYVDAGGTPEAAIERFAHAVAEVLDDRMRRSKMAVEGRRRAEQFLDWHPQREAYVGVFDALTGHRSASAPRPMAACSGSDTWGHQLVDVTDDHAVSTPRGIRPANDATAARSASPART